MGDLFRINSNMLAAFSQRVLARNYQNLQKAEERLASGLRINRAADDAAGLAISERMRASHRGLKQARANAQDGISLLQTAEGGLDYVMENLQNIQALAIKAASDGLTDQDRELINSEVTQLVNEIDRSVSSVQFNKRQLLKNDFGLMGNNGALDQLGNSSLTFHVGANRDEVVRVTNNDIQTTTGVSLGLRDFETDEVFPVLTRELAESAIEVTSNAIDMVSQTRANVGALENRLQGTVNFLRIQEENTEAAESRIRDADIAQETINQTRASILTQAGMAILLQAQQRPMMALQLLP